MQTDKKRSLQVIKDEATRMHYTALIHNLSLPSSVRMYYVTKLAQLKRYGSKVRVKNHCTLTGRSRGVYRFCKLSRIAFRRAAAQGYLPGVVKSSW